MHLDKKGEHSTNIERNHDERDSVGHDCQANVGVSESAKPERPVRLRL